MVVLKGEMSRDLYGLIGEVQMGVAASGAFATDSSRRRVARRK